MPMVPPLKCGPSPFGWKAWTSSTRASSTLARGVRYESQAVGWADQNYFARRFKAHHGLTATAYRRAFRHSTTPAPRTWG